MKKSFKTSHQNRDGAMLPFVALVIIVLFAAAVFAIDVASIHVVRSELRTATDAAAKAGVEALGREQSTEAAIEAALRLLRKTSSLVKDFNSTQTISSLALRDKTPMALSFSMKEARH